jgi:L,D-transpeptidase ErfK/SrfK
MNSFIKKQFVSIDQAPLAKIITLLAFFLLNACQIVPDAFRPDKQSLETIQTNNFVLSENDSVIGQIAAVHSRKGETLPDIARHFGLGFNEIMHANKKLKIWQLTEASKVILPLEFILPNAPHEGVVINVANMRLFYFPTDSNTRSPKSVFSFPLGIGKEGWSTPLGETRIIRKTKAPKWHVPFSIREEHALKGDPLPAVIQAGPDNPLGAYAMHLGFPGYLIHGTNKPYGVGLRVSHGCVRMYPENIETLFSQASVGTKVTIVNQPYLIGWRDKMLFLEVHSSVDEHSKNIKQLKKQLLNKFKQKSETAGTTIDWDKVKKILAMSTGIPQPVLTTVNANTVSSHKIPLAKRPDTLYGIPIIPPLKDNTWSVIAATFLHKENADKLAAILNHQGPQITSRVIGNEENYRVVAGPYEHKKQADEIVQRMKRDFEIDALVKKVDSYNLAD